MYICIYVYMYICIYVYIYTYTCVACSSTQPQWQQSVKVMPALMMIPFATRILTEYPTQFKRQPSINEVARLGSASCLEPKLGTTVHVIKYVQDTNKEQKNLHCCRYDRRLLLYWNFAYTYTYTYTCSYTHTYAYTYTYIYIYIYICICICIHIW